MKYSAAKITKIISNTCFISWVWMHTHPFCIKLTGKGGIGVQQVSLFTLTFTKVKHQLQSGVFLGVGNRLP